MISIEERHLYKVSGLELDRGWRFERKRLLFRISREHGRFWAGHTHDDLAQMLVSLLPRLNNAAGIVDTTRVSLKA